MCLSGKLEVYLEVEDRVLVWIRKSPLVEGCWARILVRPREVEAATGVFLDYLMMKAEEVFVSLFVGGGD